MTKMINIDDTVKNEQRQQQALTFLLETLPAVAPKLALPPDASLLSLRQLGIGSLGAIALQYRMSQHFGKRLPLEIMLSDTPLDKIAELLADGGTETEILL